MTLPFTPPYEFEAATFNPFNLIEFRKFVIDNKVFATALSFLIATQLKDVVDAFLQGFINPIIMRDADNDGKPDLLELDTWTVQFMGINFKVGKIVVEIIKFTVVLYTLFIITRFFRDIVN